MEAGRGNSYRKADFSPQEFSPNVHCRYIPQHTWPETNSVRHKTPSGWWLSSGFSEVSWKPGLHLPIAMQEPEPIKKTACNKGSLSFLFAFRGQFSYFHFSFISYSCSLATVHHFCVSHFSSPSLVLSLLIPQVPSTCSPVTGRCLPLHQ